MEAHTVKPFDGDIDDYNKYVLERSGGGDGRRIKKDRGEPRQAMPVRQDAVRAAKKRGPNNKTHIGDRGKVAQISRSDFTHRTTLADPAAFSKDPAKAALLSAQRGELERLLVVAEEEWLSLAGAIDAAQETAARIE